MRLRVKSSTLTEKYMLRESPGTVYHCTRPHTSCRRLPRGEKHAISELCHSRVTACWKRKSLLATHMCILELIQNWLYFPNALENILLCANLYCNLSVPPPLHFYNEIRVFLFLFIFCISSPVVCGWVNISGKYLTASKTISCIFFSFDAVCI